MTGMASTQRKEQSNDEKKRVCSARPEYLLGKSKRSGEVLNALAIYHNRKPEAEKKKESNNSHSIGGYCWASP